MAISQKQIAGARKHLEMLAANGRDFSIREMARDVLAGKLDLRAAMVNPKYDRVLTESVTSFSDWYRNLSAEDRATQERQAEAYRTELSVEEERAAVLPVARDLQL